MKTLKITSAAVLFFFLSGFVSVYSANRNYEKGVKPASVVRYEVNVSIPADIDLCNAYLVVLIDGHGNQVAAPQGFIPGKSSYLFMEAASTAGVRGARLILNTEMMHYICANELSQAPTFHQGPFMTGQTYVFDLSPLVKTHPEAKTKDAPRE